MNEATPIAVSLEFTPNPNTLKFRINRPLLPYGSVNFLSVAEAVEAPLAQKLFAIPGVQALLMGTNFITITKTDAGAWDVLAEEVPKTLESYLGQNLPLFTSNWKREAPAVVGSDVEGRIREILDSDIRPAVAMDGGDITFSKFEDGVVYLHLQGACSSCPSSIATLKMGVEARLRDSIPEVKEVVQV